MRNEIRPDHVAVYIRWSTEDQGEGTTLVVQKEACEHYVLSQGWCINDDLIFIDEGWSGGNLDRPALTKLRQLVLRDAIDCIVVYKIDRLSRNVVDTVNLVLQEWDDRTYLKSAREPIDTTNAMGKQFFYMLVSYAEWERNVIKERTFSGKLKRASDGRSPGMRRAYGYARGEQTGSFVVVPEQAEVVRRVFDLAQGGQSVRQITFHLNDLKVPSQRGMEWNTSMVSKMLHNPIYTGRLVWGRQQINPRWKKDPAATRLRKSQPHVDRATATIPAVIKPEQFDRVQLLMGQNRKIAPAALGSGHLLTGLLRCARCGSTMEYNSSGPNGGWQYYRCRERVNHGTCTAMAVRAERVEAAVHQSLQDRYEALVRFELTETNAQHQRQLRERNRSATCMMEQQLERLGDQVKRVNQDYRQGLMDIQERRELLKEVQAERTRMVARLEQLKEEAEQLDAAKRAMVWQIEHLQDVSLWADLTVEQQKVLLRQFIRNVRVGRSGSELQVDIEWHGEGPEEGADADAETDAETAAD